MLALVLALIGGALMLAHLANSFLEKTRSQPGLLEPRTLLARPYGRLARQGEPRDLIRTIPEGRR